MKTWQVDACFLKIVNIFRIKIVRNADFSHSDGPVMIHQTG